MNDWMVPRLRRDDSYRADRGKVLTAEQLEKMQAFCRHLDMDGDGVTARTLPGVHPKGAYFTRGWSVDVACVSIRSRRARGCQRGGGREA